MTIDALHEIHAVQEVQQRRYTICRERSYGPSGWLGFYEESHLERHSSNHAGQVLIGRYNWVCRY